MILYINPNQKPLFYIPPLRPVREKLTWNTAVFTSFSGEETRYANQTLPHRTLEYTYSFTRGEWITIHRELGRSPGTYWYVPLWTHKIEGDMHSDRVTVIPLGNFTVSAGQYLLFIAENEAYYKKIATVGKSITIEERLPGSTTRFSLVPLNLAALPEAPKLSRQGQRTLLSLSFLLMDDQYSIEYKGDEFYKEKPLVQWKAVAANTRTKGLSGQLDTNIVKTDWGFDNIDIVSEWGRAKISTRYEMVLQDDEIDHFVSLLYWAQGKVGSFWVSLYDHFIEIGKMPGPTVFQQLIIKNGLPLARKDIAIHLSGNQILGRYAKAESNTRITFDSHLNLPVDSILMLSYLVEVRFVSDSISMEWVAHNMVRVKFSLIEV